MLESSSTLNHTTATCIHWSGEVLTSYVKPPHVSPGLQIIRAPPEVTERSCLPCTDTDE